MYEDVAPLARRENGKHALWKATFAGNACALKEFSLQDANNMRAFRREVKMLYRLRQSTCVPIEAAFIDKHRGFIQMPLFQQDLAAWAAQRADCHKSCSRSRRRWYERWTSCTNATLYTETSSCLTFLWPPTAVRDWLTLSSRVLWKRPAQSVQATLQEEAYAGHQNTLPQSCGAWGGAQRWLQIAIVWVCCYGSCCAGARRRVMQLRRLQSTLLILFSVSVLKIQVIAYGPPTRHASTASANPPPEEKTCPRTG